MGSDRTPVEDMMFVEPRAWADVRDFGAVLDGVTGDGPAIQRAIDAAAAADEFRRIWG